MFNVESSRSYRSARAAAAARARLCAIVSLACAAPVGLGQSSRRAAFVANNGNLEGSVSSFLFDETGHPQFVMKLVTGSKPTSQDYDAGTNAYAITLSPNGRWLATTHATSSTTVERISMLEVHSDATLEAFARFQTPDSSLDAQWLTDEFLAVLLTNLSVPNKVIVYHFDSAGPSLTEIDREDCGSFSTALVLHPNRQLLFAQNSSGNTISSFRINANGTLDFLSAVSSGSTYPLGPGITRDGTKLYSCGGISNGGNKVSGFHVDGATGVLTAMAGSPFVSPGASPKLAVGTPDDAFLIVAHGTDATFRSFTINAATGALTATGAVFDVGLQGTLGDMAFLDDLLLVTDNSTAIDGVQGLYAFTVNSDGTFTQHGAIVASQGTAPTYIATWRPPCDPCDTNCDGSVNLFDTQPFIDAINGHGTTCSACAADANRDGSVNLFDIQGFVECLSG